MTKIGWAAAVDHMQAEVLSSYVDAKRKTEQVHREQRSWKTCSPCLEKLCPFQSHLQRNTSLKAHIFVAL